MSLLTKLKPKPQAYALDAHFVPGHWFFCRRIEIPADLEKGEEEGFLMLELEGMSPFPLEHLYCGYRLDSERRYAFVFAAYRRRFGGVDQAAWRRLDAVLPDFLIGLSSDARVSGPLVLETESSYVAFRYDGNSDLPVAFFAEPKPKNQDGEEQQGEEGLSAFLRRASDSIGVKGPCVWKVNTRKEWVGSQAWLGVDEPSKGCEHVVSFSRGDIWKADVRDPEMVEQARKDERQNAIIWKGVLGIAALVGLLFIGEIYWAGSEAYLALRRSQNEKRAPLVEDFNELNDTTRALQLFQESNLVPFQMIESLAPLQNYPKVVYRKFETSDPNVLVIEARSQNSSEVTAFKKRLEAFGKISSVELSNQVNNPSGSTFTATIRFVPGAFFELAEVSTNE
ncbi:hypothetical protein [Pelagicoccus sp. SDUM812003]|uniref:hypothetical protein n=1 Tax=Pelagicoccus sp. SDUM812003 TaxID=3041267 RepID=UPI00281003F0|nr:hypothetical protein [Pelagicoccus sp. SDUM812003]MDQ8202964.1 hypothetical protein [Pelagicoccus sp. SDUM812003]